MVGATGRHLGLSSTRSTCAVVSALTAVNRYLSVQAVGVELGARGGVSTASAQTATRKAANGRISRVVKIRHARIKNSGEMLSMRR